MSVSIAQYVDLLVKKLYGVAKTDTETNKSPSNESIESPALNRGDTCWTEADAIPDIATATPNLVTAYRFGNAVQCVADTTTVAIGGIYPTWLTNIPEWIPPEFGATYSVQAYVGPPGAANIVATGTFISSAGQAGSGEWFFDYQAGLLNFIGQTIPPSLTSGNVVYITGYAYSGLTGVTNLPNNSNIGNITITDTTISSNNANLVAFGGNAGVVIPAGNTFQQPVNPPVGTTRFNISTNLLESWDGATWISGGGGGGGGSGTIVDQQIIPDGTSTTYTLIQAATTVGVLVSINGINQIPDVAYTVNGTDITFNQVPLTADIIDIRFISYMSTVSALVNSTGNSSVSVSSGGNINFTTANVTQATINTAGVFDISGQSLQLPSYTVAEASNIATPNAGEVIYVSNGDAGAPSLAVFDGSTWKRIALGTTISAT